MRTPLTRCKLYLVCIPRGQLYCIACRSDLYPDLIPRTYVTHHTYSVYFYFLCSTRYLVLVMILLHSAVIRYNNCFVSARGCRPHCTCHILLARIHSVMTRTYVCVCICMYMRVRSNIGVRRA